MSPVRLWFLIAILLCLGCASTGGDPVDVPPSTPPDAATVALLTGTWQGISHADNGLDDYLTFEFFPSGEFLRVRVFLNDGPLATPYADIQGDRLTIDAADTSGTSGTFTGDLDRPNLKITGDFTSHINGSDQTGTFDVEKQ